MTNVEHHIQQNDQRYIESRRKEMQRYIDIFSEQLFKIYSVMPVPARILNVSTGEWTVKQNEEWQPLIDKLLKEQQQILETTFPEFFISKTTE